jgi:hypothetical protein
VRRILILLAALFAAAVLAPWHLRALTDEEKKAMFLKAREEMQTISTPTPAAEEATPKPKPRARHKTGQHATPKPAATSQPPEESAPEPQPAATPRPPHRLPPPVPSPTPAPTPPPAARFLPPPPAPVMISKSGYQRPMGMAPPPPRYFWESWNNFRYLTRSVREQIDRAPVQRNRWRYIVVHNSGTRQGNARIFDLYHRYVRRMPNGLAYQFVIGNGTSSGNGQIEVGDRWRRQINGGHVHSDYLNNIALGICLVGDFNRDLPTREQLGALDELIRYLRIRVGKIDGRWAIVKAHRDINPPQWPTDCPGDRFPFGWLYSSFR